jgi:membrane protease YdiL (CAAX protease family)
MSERSNRDPYDGIESNASRPGEVPNESGGTGRNRFGHIRAGWRMAIYLGVVILVFLPVIGALKAFSFLLPAQTDGENIASAINIVFMLGIDIALVLAAWITLRWIDRRPFALLGMSFSADGVKELLTGLVFGFLFLTVIFLILRAAGLVDVTAGGMNSQTLETMLRYLVVFTVAGLLEEVVNRGYLLQAFIEGTRAWIAILGFSLIFSLGHIFNEDFSWVSGLCLFLHGILFGLIYFKTRSLWIPIGMHIAWNWTQGPLWGMKVSGTAIAHTFMVSVPKGPQLVSGGDFGAEGSLITVIVSAALVLYVWKANWIKPTHRMATLWRRYPAGFGLTPFEP